MPQLNDADKNRQTTNNKEPAKEITKPPHKENKLDEIRNLYNRYQII